MTADLSKPAEIAWACLVRVQQSSIARVEDALRNAGFPPLIWYDILLELERIETGDLRQRDLQREMLLKRYSITRLVDRMEAAGLLAREACEEDARGSIVRITDQGRTLRQSMWTVYADAVSEHFAGRFNDYELDRLGELLGRLRD